MQIVSRGTIVFVAVSILAIRTAVAFHFSMVMANAEVSTASTIQKAKASATVIKSGVVA